MNKQTGLPGREASSNKSTDTPLTPVKRPPSKPSPRKNGSSNTQTITSQTASTNWTGQSRLFWGGWELDTTDLMPTYTTSSRLATSWLQNIYCSTVDYMMLCCGTCGLNRRYWGTSSMATWSSWGGQPPSWGQQASPSSVWRWRRSTVICLYADWQTSRRLFLDRWDSSCARTTFSRILERNGRLETGLKLFKPFISSPGFLSRGLTMADLKQPWTMLVAREVYMILVVMGTRTSSTVWWGVLG